MPYSIPNDKGFGGGSLINGDQLSPSIPLLHSLLGWVVVDGSDTPKAVSSFPQERKSFGGRSVGWLEAAAAAEKTNQNRIDVRVCMWTHS